MTARRSIVILAHVLFLVLLLVATATIACAYTECVPNPGFEAGTGTTALGWYMGTYGTQTGVSEALTDAGIAHSGSRLGHMNITSWTNGYRYQNPNTGNVIPVFPSSTYNLSFYMKGWTAGASGVLVTPYWMNGTMQPMGNYTYRQYVGLNNDTYVFQTVYLTTNAWTYYVKLAYYLSNGTGEIWYDDVTMHLAAEDTQLQFTAYSYTANQTDEKVTITVTRTGSQPPAPVSVQYATGDDTAVAGTDYTATSGTLVFDTTDQSKSFDVAILNNNTTTTNVVFHVSLSGYNGVTAGTPTTASVVILASPPEATPTPTPEPTPTPTPTPGVTTLEGGCPPPAAALLGGVGVASGIVAFALARNAWRAGLVFAALASFLCFLLGVMLNAGVVFEYVGNTATVVQPPYLSVIMWAFGTVFALLFILYLMDAFLTQGMAKSRRGI